MEERSWWVHDLDPVLLELWGDVAVRWYGLAYLAGFAAAYFLLRAATKKGRSPLSFQQIETLMTWCIVGVLAGGRVGYMLLYSLGDFLQNPLILFRVNEGGMSFHGGAIGVIAALLLVAKRQKLRGRDVGDLVVITVPFGLFFGRIANFINGELWGHVTSVPWAVIFPQAPVVSQQPMVFVAQLQDYANPRHPSQLYEAALEGLLLGIYLNLRFWKRNPRKTPAGQIAGEFLVGYAILRSIGEIFRVPDAELILGLSRGTFYSLLMLLGGVAVISWARWKDRKEASATA